MTTLYIPELRITANKSKNGVIDGFTIEGLGHTFADISAVRAAEVLKDYLLSKQTNVLSAITARRIANYTIHSLLDDEKISELGRSENNVPPSD